MDPLIRLSVSCCWKSPRRPLNWKDVEQRIQAWYSQRPFHLEMLMRLLSSANAETPNRAGGRWANDTICPQALKKKMAQISVYLYQCDRKHLKNPKWNLYMPSLSPFWDNYSCSEFLQSPRLSTLTLI